jgi:tetratricopeptide (TPR) repeat protein
MAGLGKSALALWVSNTSTYEFPGGVFWSSLGNHGGDANPILSYWANACGAELGGNLNEVARADLLRHWLNVFAEERGRILMVVDDARLEWRDALEVLLRTLPNKSALLLTTREETISLIAECEEVLPEVLPPSDACSLLLRHAGMGAEGLEEPDIQEMITLVGSLPLALELLGKQILRLSAKPGFSVESLLQELREAVLAVLNLPGHAGVAATFQISYRALDDSEKRAFRWIGAFGANAFASSDLAGITGTADKAMAELLDRLVASSLVAWTDRPGYFRIHPLLHEYGLDLLRACDEESAARTAHLHHFGSLVKAVPPDTRGMVWVGLLPELLHGIARAGVTSPGLVLDLASLLWIETDYLPHQGFYREGVQLLESAVASARKLGRAHEEAMHTGNLGIAYDVLGNPTEAKKCFKAAISLSTLLEEDYDRPAYIGNLGMIYRREGNRKQALKNFEKSLRLSIKAENWAVAADQCGHLGTEFRWEEPSRAMEYYRQGLKFGMLTKEEHAVARLLANIGLLHLDAHRYGKAVEHLVAALELSRSAGDRQLEANLLGHMGTVSFVQGDLKQAMKYCTKAVTMFEGIGYQMREGQWLSNLGWIHRALGDSETALEYIQRALVISTHVADREGEALGHIRLSYLFEDAGKLETARQHRSEGDRILSEIPSPISIWWER